MSIIDFEEIPEAHISSGKQDTFELFAKEFFKEMGFKIITFPDRGQDDGKDLIVMETSNGLISESKFKWLVSCKHKAHSGKSVTKSVENDVYDRVKQHSCDGFIAFYSTLPSASLNKKLNSLKNKIKISIFDCEEIEEKLLSNSRMYSLIKRFFPKSYKKIDLKRPSNLLDNYFPLECDNCGKDLLRRSAVDKYNGIMVLIEDTDYSEKNNYKKTRITDVYLACKGDCDNKLKSKYSSSDRISSWQDISDLVIPYLHLKFNIAIMNRLESSKDEYTERAFEKIKDCIIGTSQIVFKNQSEKDIKRVRRVIQIPDWL